MLECFTKLPNQWFLSASKYTWGSAKTYKINFGINIHIAFIKNSSQWKLIVINMLTKSDKKETRFKAEKRH